MKFAEWLTKEFETFEYDTDELSSKGLEEIVAHEVLTSIIMKTENDMELGGFIIAQFKKLYDAQQSISDLEDLLAERDMKVEQLEGQLFI